MLWERIRLHWDCIQLFWELISLLWELIRLLWELIWVLWERMRLLWELIRLLWECIRMPWEPSWGPQPPAVRWERIFPNGLMAVRVAGNQAGSTIWEVVSGTRRGARALLHTKRMVNLSTVWKAAGKRFPYCPHSHPSHAEFRELKR